MTDVLRLDIAHSFEEVVLYLKIFFHSSLPNFL